MVQDNFAVDPACSHVIALEIPHYYFVKKVTLFSPFIIYSLFLGRLLRVDLIKWVSNVRPSVCPSTKSFFDFKEIWYVG